MGDEIAGQVLLLSHSNILFSGVLATDLHQRYAVREMVLRLIALAVLFAAYVLPGCVGLDNASLFPLGVLTDARTISPSLVQSTSLLFLMRGRTSQPCLSSL